MTSGVDRLPANASDKRTEYRYSASVDVPGELVSRVTDLYAEEERRRRAARTELMIQKAQSAH